MPRREKGSPVMFNLRLRPTERGVKVTRAALDAVTEYVKQNDAALPGWEVAYIEWRNPSKASSGWKRGAEEDLALLGRVLRAMPQSVKLRKAEIDEPEQPRGTKRQLKKAIERMEKWHRERSKAVRHADKMKTKEKREEWRDKAERYRRRYQRAQKRVEELQEPEFPEFELAVEYKGKGRK